MWWSGRRWSIAGQLFALQALVVTLLVAGGTTGAVLLARADAREAATEKVVAIARLASARDRGGHPRCARTTHRPGSSRTPRRTARPPAPTSSS